MPINLIGALEERLTAAAVTSYAALSHYKQQSGSLF